MYRVSQQSFSSKSATDSHWAPVPRAYGDGRVAAPSCCRRGGRSSTSTSASRSSRRSTRTAPPTTSCRERLALAKLGKLANFANFWRALSRLYQNEILQENMSLTSFFKLYKICILLHRCNLKIFTKNRFENSAIFVKIQQKFCKSRKFCKISNLPNFKNFS